MPSHHQAHKVVAVGSLNKTKIEAVTSALAHCDVTVVPVDASSQVTHQPLTEAETRLGAVSRARDCLEKTEADLAIGLEAGVFFEDDVVYLCHWGALVDREGAVYLTNGPIIRMPSSYKAPLLEGANLQDLMHTTTGIVELGKKEGAVGIFTHNMVTRHCCQKEIVKVLWGQYLYFSSIKTQTLS